jgi:hypothetical protein
MNILFTVEEESGVFEGPFVMALASTRSTKLTRFVSQRPVVNSCSWSFLLHILLFPFCFYFKIMFVLRRGHLGQFDRRGFHSGAFGDARAT